MNKPMIYIFFDDIVREYQNHYYGVWENKLVKDLQKYLSDFSKTSKISIITRQNTLELSDWFSKHDLYKFVDNISNPAIYYSGSL